MRPDLPSLYFAVTPLERVQVDDDDPAFQARVAELRGELDTADPARHEAELDALVDAFSARIAVDRRTGAMRLGAPVRDRAAAKTRGGRSAR